MRATIFVAGMIAGAVLLSSLTATDLTVATSGTADGPRLYRVILPAKNIAATTDWYQELLGIRGEFVGPNRFYLHCGGVILALVEPAAGTAPRPNQEYIYLAVADLKPYHQRATRLNALDLEMGKIERRPWGEVSFYAHDPLGNPLCFVDEKTLFTGTKPPDKGKN